MSASPSPLPALAARAQLGDRAALELLLRALAPGLRHHLHVLLSDETDAEDALQEALWLVTRRLGTLRDVALVRAWAYRVATREAMHLLRRARQHPTEALSDVESQELHATGVEHATDAWDEELLAHIDRLPVNARVVVRLRFIEDLSQQEIAEALEIPLGTVKSRLAYGLERLRILLRAARAP